jgi:hypothetical protein
MNDVAHSCDIACIYLRSLSHLEGTTRSFMSFFLLQILTSPFRSLLTYSNISGNINWSYMINVTNLINRLNCLPLKGNFILDMLTLSNFVPLIDK